MTDKQLNKARLDWSLARAEAIVLRREYSALNAAQSEKSK